MDYVFDPAPPAALEIAGMDEYFPVRRIYCVGRNYAAHTREMGHDPDREPPFFFTKPADAVVANGRTIPFPSETRNLHHEIELVAAIGREANNVAVANANDYLFGYAVGNDLTRRDLQMEAREKGRPWDTGKAFDHSAPMTAIHPIQSTGVLDRGRIWLEVNGTMRQEADLKDLIWSVPEVIATLSRLFVLRPGDLVFTGTPAGVGAVDPGDIMTGSVAGLPVLETSIGPSE